MRYSVIVSVEANDEKQAFDVVEEAMDRYLTEEVKRWQRKAKGARRIVDGEVHVATPDGMRSTLF